MIDEWTMPPQAEYDATCVTAGCENENVPIPITADATNPTVQCGPCGQMITNITPA